MKAVVAAFNQEKALVGAFSVITNLQMELFEALVFNQRCLDNVFHPHYLISPGWVCGCMKGHHHYCYWILCSLTTGDQGNAVRAVAGTNAIC